MILQVESPLMVQATLFVDIRALICVYSDGLLTLQFKSRFCAKFRALVRFERPAERASDLLCQDKLGGDLPGRRRMMRISALTIGFSNIGSG